jgi:peptide/nickel transport system substrate-binding protein
MLHKIQQLMHERVMFAPIVEQAALTGVGPRVAEAPIITGHPFISPYEDLRLR